MMSLGISFYVFQSLGYCIDVYTETVKAEKNFLKLALFISFFPTILQGPIERYELFSGQLLGGGNVIFNVGGNNEVGIYYSTSFDKYTENLSYRRGKPELSKSKIEKNYLQYQRCFK